MNKKPEIVTVVTNKYIIGGLKLNGYWMQPFRAVVRDRSKYKPHQNLKEKERRKKQCLLNS